MACRNVPLALAWAVQPLHPSLREWPRLPSTARIGRAHSYHARSASKEGTWPVPPDPSQAARYASKRDNGLSFTSYTGGVRGRTGWSAAGLAVTPPPFLIASYSPSATPASTGKTASRRRCPIPLPHSAPGAASCPAHSLRH